MNLKISIVVLINALWALFPQNIIGCGPEPDPKDYYTSFFTNAHVPDQSYKPFFYTTLLKFYDDWDWMEENGTKNAPDALIAEWQTYAGREVTREQVEELVYQVPDSVIRFALDKAAGIKSKEPSDYAAFEGNKVLTRLLKQGKQEALTYLVFAKQVQDHVYTIDPWEAPIKKDSLKLVKLFQKAETMQRQTKDPFIQTKYSFIQCRLAFYGGNYPLCIKMADTWFGETAPPSAVKAMAVGYRAGSYFKIGKNADAALWFARAFQMSPENRKKNYLGFWWSADKGKASVQPSILAKAADNKEKAFITGLFALHGVEYGLNNIRKMYSLDPQCELLPMLVVREIEKLEEYYLSPMLGAQKGAGGLFYATGSKPEKEHAEHAVEVLAFFEQLAANKSLPQNNLYKVGAAYIAYMTGSQEKAGQWAADMKMGDNAVLRQQALLIQLLSAIAGYPQMNTAAEAEILPMLQSLYKIAEIDIEYRVFMRNLYVQVLAPKYFAQGNVHKTALCFGVANLAFMPEPADPNQYYYSGYATAGIDYVRNDFSTEQAIGLFNFLKGSSLSAYEKFLLEKSSFGKDDVADFIGTSYLRDYAWKNAIDWLQKAEKRDYLVGYAYNQDTYEYDSVFVNPFHDYLNDWQRYEKPLTKPMDKLDLARKMVNLEYQLDTTTNKAQKGKTAYLLGSAYYNLSYYGNSWMAMDYGRSTYLWNNGKYTGWRKEYFEVQKARKYYQMAYELSGVNKEFQAAAFFLVAKCAQRQIPRQDYDYNNWKAADKAEKEFTKKFINNPLFPQFKKEFGATKFYKYTLTRCSYLADFDKRK
jgi:hypothetical protein